MRLKRSSNYTVDSVFILALMALFGIISVYVIMIGAKQYKSIADRMSQNYETRTVASYLEEKLSQSDVSGSADVVMLDSVEALVLTDNINGQLYNTYIYAYDGYLLEITVSDGTEVSPGSGQKLIETGSLKTDMVSSNLFHFTITDTTGMDYSLFVSLKSKQ